MKEKLNSLLEIYTKFRKGLIKIAREFKDQIDGSDDEEIRKLHARLSVGIIELGNNKDKDLSSFVAYAKRLWAEAERNRKVCEANYYLEYKKQNTKNGKPPTGKEIEAAVYNNCQSNRIIEEDAEYMYRRLAEIRAEAETLLISMAIKVKN